MLEGSLAYEMRPMISKIEGLQVDWDVFIAHYGADCDYYPRVRAAGWDASNAADVCPDAAIKVLQLSHRGHCKSMRLLHARLRRRLW